MLPHTWKITRTLLCALCLAAALIGFWTAQAGRHPIAQADKPQSQRAQFVPGELLVRFRTPQQAHAAERELTALTTPQGKIIALHIANFAGAEIVPGLRLGRVAADDLPAALELLAKRPEVLYAEPNYTRQAFATPNDPQFSQLWGLNNTGQTGGTAGADIRAVSAWDTTTGSRNIAVGIVDEGIAINHPDLQANIWQNPGETPSNGVDDDGNGYIDDTNGWDFFHNDRTVYDGTTGDNVTDAHGTHVAGIVGATGNNGLGVVGVNWQVSLISLKILGRDGEAPPSGNVVSLVTAFSYAKNLREMWETSGGTHGANLRVLNNSYGGPFRSQAELDAITALNSAGILFVVAAGNDQRDADRFPEYPAAYDAPNVISVAATTRYNTRALFSNSGATTVHLGAPGAEILSTVPNGGYALADGTSMAAPHVAGAAALLWAAQPNASAARVRAALLAGVNTNAGLTGQVATHGRLDARRSLQLVEQVDTTPPALGALTILSQEGRNVTLRWTNPGDDGLNGRAALYEFRFIAPTGATYRLSTLTPGEAGALGTVSVKVPYRQPSGTLELRAYDDGGNTASASVPVMVAADASDPYLVTTQLNAPLSTGGTRFLNTDEGGVNFNLGFSFPFFENINLTQVYVSPNGLIYPGSPNTNDALSSAVWLAGLPIVAGLWDDLDLRTQFRAESGVYWLKPTSDSIIFRWQGVVYGTTRPVNCEIELRHDGTIIKRYGAGNQGVFATVGISGGEPESYLVASHSYTAAPISLNFAPTVVYTRRNVPRRADVQIVSAVSQPNLARAGYNFAYHIQLRNNGPDAAASANLITSLPSGVDFVACAASVGTCASEGNGRVTANFGTLENNATAEVIITLRAVIANGAEYLASVSANTQAYDPNFGNNSATISTPTIAAHPNPLTHGVQVAAGSEVTYVLRDDGTVVGWGNTVVFANNTLGSNYTPVRLPLNNVIALAACPIECGYALKTNGTVWAWGKNAQYQLGDGTTTPRFWPVQMPNLTQVRQVVAGAALRQDGSVWTWGPYAGDGTSSPRPLPAPLAGMTNVRGLAAGGSHTLAVKQDGTVWAWGRNFAGQIGDGTTIDRLQPLQVPGIANAVAVAAGNSHSFALLADGTIRAWGYNGLGQVGDGTSNARLSPVPVLGITNAVAVTGGVAHSLALLADGTMRAWGHNSDGQLGTLRTQLVISTPDAVRLLDNVRSISAGSAFSVAVTQDGRVHSWGSGSRGKLGNGNETSRGYPWEVNAALPDVPTIGQVTAPVLNPAGGVFTTRPTVTAQSATAANGINFMATGASSSFARLQDGRTYAWGNNYAGQLGFLPTPNNYSTWLPQQIDVPNNAVVASGLQHTLMLHQGRVWSWGSNSNGQLGNGTTNTTPNPPAPINSLDNITAIAARQNRSMALRQDGTVWVWGVGRINGDAAPAERTTPVQVAALDGVIRIAVGNTFNLALKTDGTLWAWGSNDRNQLGDGSRLERTAPVRVANLSNVTAITAGYDHALALRSDGKVWVWGDNTSGQLGLGVSDAWRETPVELPGLSGLAEVQAGHAFSLVRGTDGRVWSWGRNVSGELGRLCCSPSYAATPGQVPLTDVQALSVGDDFVLALRTDGRLWSWGSYSNGNLSNGLNDFSYLPTLAIFLTDGVTVRYTTDGSDPDDTSPILPVNGLRLEQTAIIKARAFKDGWTPSTVTSATFTVNLPQNQIDDPRFFVRQHYLDFLSREPDAAGWDYWTAQITVCGADAACHHQRRLGVSAAFFIELEFQESGAFIYRFYQASLGRRPAYAEFTPDRAQVVGGTDLEQSKQAFALAWVQRPEFILKYPTGQTAEQFVDALLATVQQASGVNLAAMRPTLLTEYAAQANPTAARARVVRLVADAPAFRQAEYNKAFVLMQYFGYLRREADTDGYNFWLDVVTNREPGNYRGMVCAFVTAAEYQLRFGSGVTRSNADCANPPN